MSTSLYLKQHWQHWDHKICGSHKCSHNGHWMQACENLLNHYNDDCKQFPLLYRYQWWDVMPLPYKLKSKRWPMEWRHANFQKKKCSEVMLTAYWRQSSAVQQGSSLTKKFVNNRIKWGTTGWTQCRYRRGGDRQRPQSSCARDTVSSAELVWKQVWSN